MNEYKNKKRITDQVEMLKADQINKSKTNTVEKSKMDQTETSKMDQTITITRNTTTNSYIVSEPISYDFYLLYLLCTTNITATADQTKKNAGINFCKKSSIPCLITSELFINKNNGYIEIFSIYDLTTNPENLCLPKSPKFIMTAKNFMNFMVQKDKIYKQQPDQFFIIIDTKGHAHLTINPQILEKTSFFSSLQKKLFHYFS